MIGAIFLTYQFDIFVRIRYPDAPSENDFPENLSESRYKSDPGPETITIFIFMINHTIQRPKKGPITLFVTKITRFDLSVTFTMSGLHS